MAATYAGMVKSDLLPLIEGRESAAARRGKSAKGVPVEYGPGGYSPSHTHAKSAIIDATVIEGAVRSQVNGGPVVTYRTGQNWTEMPGDHHRVSANASKSRAAKILAVFVVDDLDAEITIPDRR